MRVKLATLIAEKSIDLVCRLVGGARGQTIIYEMLSRVINQRAKAKIEGPDETVDAFDELMRLTLEIDEVEE